MTLPPDGPIRRLPNEVSVAWLEGVLWLHRRRIGLAVLGATVVFAGILLLLPNTYTSRASILPTTQQSQLSEIKSLMGIPSIEAGIEATSELYPEILRSRRVKDAVLHTVYTFDHDEEVRQMSLQEYVGESDPELLYRALDQALTIDVDNKTGLIRLALETKYADLSRNVLSQYLTELENITRLKRNSKAADNARYLSEQLMLQTKELEMAEDSLEAFRMANRNWNQTSSPEIVKNDQRLRRQVELKGTTVLYLSQEYEAAKFEAQKNTPILRVLDEPSLPSRKSGPFRTLILASIVCLTFLLASGTAVVYEAIMREPGSHEIVGRIGRASLHAPSMPSRLLRFIRPATKVPSGPPTEGVDQNEPESRRS